MFYIQRRDGKQLETIDEFESHKEAAQMCREYNIADQSAYHYVSKRACNAYTQSNHAGAIQ